MFGSMFWKNFLLTVYENESSLEKRRNIVFFVKKFERFNNWTWSKRTSSFLTCSLFSFPKMRIFFQKPFLFSSLERHWTFLFVMEIELNFFFLLRSHLPSMSLCFATILQFREQIDPFSLNLCTCFNYQITLLPLLSCRPELHRSREEIEGKWSKCSCWVSFPLLVASSVDCFLSSIQYHSDHLVSTLILSQWQSKWMHHARTGFYKCFPPILPGICCFICSIKLVSHFFIWPLMVFLCLPGIW